MSYGDRISLKGVRARGFHGVLDLEKRDGQDFVVDVTLYLDLSTAGASDDLHDTVSYAEVAAEVVALVQGPPLDLIEALAERIARAALRRPEVRSVEVTVHKPQAPVGVPFTDVSVTVDRDRDEPVVIALGANLGDPAAALRSAVEELWLTLEVTGVSSVYQTVPVGGPAQPDYLNAVVVGRTANSGPGLLAELHKIEQASGRTRGVRWGPRTLDLDLIQYGDPAFDTDVRSDRPTLLLPHPRAHERAFVLRPWLEVDPDAALRVQGRVRRVADLVATVDGSGVRVRTDLTLSEGEL